MIHIQTSLSPSKEEGDEFFFRTACGLLARLQNCTCDATKVTCVACFNTMEIEDSLVQHNTSEELSIIPVTRLEWDSQRMTVLCEFIIQKLKDGAKIPDAIREELNDLLYLYVEPKQEA